MNFVTKKKKKRHLLYISLFNIYRPRNKLANSVDVLFLKQNVGSYPSFSSVLSLLTTEDYQVTTPKMFGTYQSFESVQKYFKICHKIEF